VLGRRAPVAGSVEAARIDRWQLVTERDAARLARARTARPPDEDREQPGAQRRAPLEAVDAAQHGEPGLLYDLLGDGAAAYEGRGEAQHGVVVVPDDGHERRLVA
jgi:hypothetical protein